MSSAWEGDWTERIQSFAKSEGFANIWDWLLAHPAIPLSKVSRQIGSIAPVQIDQLVVSHCQANDCLTEWMRDKLVRHLNDALPKGWKTPIAFKQISAFVSWRSGFPRKYDALLERMQEIIFSQPIPKGWIPSSKDGPFLVQAFNQASAEVQVDHSTTEPGEKYWSMVAPIWNKLSIYEPADVFVEEYSKAPRKSALLFAAHWCQSEVRNGGFHQFFGNPTGILAPEALAAFKAMDLREWASVLEEAMMFFGEPYPREQSPRLYTLTKLSPEIFRDLDDRFFEWSNAEENRFELAADRFASSAFN